MCGVCCFGGIRIDYSFFFLFVLLTWGVGLKEHSE